MGAEARQKPVPSATRKKPHRKAPAPRRRPPAKKAARPRPKAAAKPASAARGASAKPAEAPAPPPLPRTGDARRHVLSLSFLRDGDEFLARMESDTGQITELKNRSLDQLLTLVASELEDLLE